MKIDTEDPEIILLKGLFLKRKKKKLTQAEHIAHRGIRNNGSDSCCCIVCRVTRVNKKILLGILRTDSEIYFDCGWRTSVLQESIMKLAELTLCVICRGVGASGNFLLLISTFVLHLWPVESHRKDMELILLVERTNQLRQ